MPGELKPRRRRRGGRGRGRRRGGAARTLNQAGPQPGQPAEAADAAPSVEAEQFEGEAAWSPEEVASGEGSGPARFETPLGVVEAWGFEPTPAPASAGREVKPDAGGSGHERGLDSGATEAVEPAAAEAGPGIPEGDHKAPGRRKRGTRGRRSRRPLRGRRERAERPERRPAAAPAGETLAPAMPAVETGGAAVVEAEPAEAAGREKPERHERAHPREHRAAAGVEKTMVINATAQETRLAILEKGQLAEIFIERESSRTVVGNIYKGRVTKVLPGMQSAFVAITLERDAFLYVSDISPGYDAYEGLLNLDEVEGGEEIRDASPRMSRDAKIEDLIKEGQELLVQVTKEPIGTKGARITSYVTLPGRFLVLMPQVDHVGVSRKIGDARERTRLRRILDKVRAPGMGFIVRTVAEGCDAVDLEADANYLTSLWEEIRRKAEKRQAPSEIHRELPVVPKVLRDMLNRNVSKVLIDDEETYRQATDLVRKLLPDMLDRIRLYREEFPIFENFGVQTELDKALRSKVWLKSGGYIVINQTEALVAIDVNTGKFVGKRNLEDTVLKTNLEAVSEIVRQLRLRDLGGIIVVDFIDMEERRSKKKLIEAFEKELQKDRARTKVLQISDFGLVEITRQRTKKSLERILCRPCPYCAGAGKIKADATVMFEIQREIQKLAKSLDGRRLIIRANPEVAQQLETDRHLLIAGIASLDRVDLAIRADSTLHHEQFDIVSM